MAYERAVHVFLCSCQDSLGCSLKSTHTRTSTPLSYVTICPSRSVDVEINKSATAGLFLLTRQQRQRGLSLSRLAVSWSRAGARAQVLPLH